MDHPLKFIFSMFRVILRKQKTHGLKYDLFSRRSDKLFGYLGGPIPEVVQYRANPWPGRSKLLFHGASSKISLVYKSLNEGRFRY